MASTPADDASSCVTPHHLMAGLFAQDKYIDALLALMAAPDSAAHYGFEIEWADLMAALPDPQAVHDLFRTRPAFLLAELDNAVREMQDLATSPLPPPQGDEGDEGGGAAAAAASPAAAAAAAQWAARFADVPVVRKYNVHVRLSRYPRLAEYSRPNVRSIRAGDKGRLLAFTGRVVSVGQRKMVVRKKCFKCASCSFEFAINIAIECVRARGGGALPRQCACADGAARRAGWEPRPTP
jgi:DNA replicative helicase MCM subunit Mcm2 (Cdc46/Mcm family)